MILTEIKIHLTLCQLNDNKNNKIQLKKTANLKLIKINFSNKTK